MQDWILFLHGWSAAHVHDVQQHMKQPSTHDPLWKTTSRRMWTKHYIFTSRLRLPWLHIRWHTEAGRKGPAPCTINLETQTKICEIKLALQASGVSLGTAVQKTYNKREGYGPPVARQAKRVRNKVAPRFDSEICEWWNGCLHPRGHLVYMQHNATLYSVRAWLLVNTRPSPEDSKRTNCDNALLLDTCVKFAVVFMLAIQICVLLQAVVICCLVLRTACFTSLQHTAPCQNNTAHAACCDVY